MMLGGTVNGKAIMPRLVRSLAIAAIIVSTPALAFRGGGFGGFGGFHGGGFGGFRGGDFGGFHGAAVRGPYGGAAAVGRGPAGGVYGAARGPFGGWHAGGVGAYGGTWHADGYHAGGYYADGFHGPAVVNGYYGGGCYACSAGWGVAAGVAAGAAIGAAATYRMGATLASLPPGNCTEQVIGIVSYYQCGATWLRGYFGNNGLYYRVVTAP
jgi:hypothetical protein